jgi:uncharacterized protein YukE
MSIDTKVQEQLGTIAAFQQSLSGFASQLGTWSGDIANDRQRALGSWTGQAADAFGQLTSKQSQQADELSATTSTFSRATQTFYDSVSKVTDGFQSLREQAAGGGLQVSGTDILEPTPPSDPDDEAAWAEYERKLALFERCYAQSCQLRSQLNEAHETYNGACDDVSAPAGVVVPLTGSQAVAGFDSLGEDLDDVESGTDYAVAGIGNVFGRYAPRAANGQFTNRLAFLTENPESLFDAASYVSKPGAQSMLSLAKGLDDVGSVAKVAGPVVSVADGIIDGAEQWHADDYDKLLSPSARVARTATVAVSDTGLSLAGGLLGAEGGAEAGAAIGSLAGPVGTAVGGVVGGVVGGIIGSGVADKIEDGIKSLVNTYMRW